MRFAVVGAGAMGSLFGGLLSEAGEDVVLVDVWGEHVNTINSRGLFIKGVSGDRTVWIRATANPSTVGVVDLVILFVKSYDTLQAAIDALPMTSEMTVFLTLQNGLGNVEKIGEVVGGTRVVAGCTSHGSTLLGPGEIYHAGMGVTIIGELDGAITARVRKISEVFGRAGIETEVSPNIEGEIWSKVMVNVGINALTALTGMRNGELLEVPEVKAVMKRAVEEAWRVAVEMGVMIDLCDPLEMVYKVAEATAENRSSMLQDVQRRRPTEIDALNGAIVELGNSLSIDTPVNEALTAAVKGLEYGRIKTRRISFRCE